MFKFVQENQSDEFLGFYTNEELYCVSLLKMQEIIYVPPISKIPNAAPYIEGAINLRGKIVRVINFRKWLSLPWRKFDENTRILVTNTKDRLIGILIDAIGRVFKAEKTTRYDLPIVFQQEAEMGYINEIILNNGTIVVEVKPEQIST